jgi:hypothetical protein
LRKKIDESVVALETLKQQVVDMRKHEAKVHKVTSKAREEISTCFEEELPHLLKASEITQYENNLVTKIVVTLRMTAKNRKGLLESAKDEKARKEQEIKE